MYKIIQTIKKVLVNTNTPYYTIRIAPHQELNSNYNH